MLKKERLTHGSCFRMEGYTICGFTWVSFQFSTSCFHVTSCNICTEITFQFFTNSNEKPNSSNKYYNLIVRYFKKIKQRDKRAQKYKGKFLIKRCWKHVKKSSSVWVPPGINCLRKFKFDFCENNFLSEFIYLTIELQITKASFSQKLED